MEKMYESLGISSRVYEFGQEIIEGLKERFEKIRSGTQSITKLKVLKRNAEKPCEQRRAWEPLPDMVTMIWEEIP